MHDYAPTIAPDHIVPATETFRAARDFLLQHRTDYDTAVRHFAGPSLSALSSRQPQPAHQKQPRCRMWPLS